MLATAPILSNVNGTISAAQIVSRKMLSAVALLCSTSVSDSREP
jgi:hypothetical protein